MHDLLLAQEILRAVEFYAQKHRLKSVNQIIIDLGRTAGCNCLLDCKHHHKGHLNEEITPKNLKYNFNLIKKRTIAADAVLEIQKAVSPGWSLKYIDGK